MTAIVIGLYVASYLLAVVDGVLGKDDRVTGLLAPSPGEVPRAGAGFVRTHPYIVAGAVCGIVGTIVELLR